MQMNAGGCCCDGLACGRTVTYPYGSAQLESDFYYALNTPSDQTFYNPVTGLTMLYTDTTGNLGALDTVGIILIRPSDDVCDFTTPTYGFTELQNFILRGHTVLIAIERGSGCFSGTERTQVLGWMSSLGAASIGITVADLYIGCQNVTNYAAANNLNSGITMWRVGGSSRFTLTGSAVSVIVDVNGYILVAAVVSSLSGNTLNGKVIMVGDNNLFNSCDTATVPQVLYDNVCDIFGMPIA